MIARRSRRLGRIGNDLALTIIKNTHVSLGGDAVSGQKLLRALKGFLGAHGKIGFRRENIFRTYHVPGSTAPQNALNVGIDTADEQMPLLFDERLI